MTDEEYEKAIPAGIKERVSRMTNEQAEARCTELRQRLIRTEPVGLETPEAGDLAEYQEYYLLKKRLGYS